MINLITFFKREYSFTDNDIRKMLLKSKKCKIFYFTNEEIDDRLQLIEKIYELDTKQVKEILLSNSDQLFWPHSKDYKSEFLRNFKEIGFDFEQTRELILKNCDLIVFDSTRLYIYNSWRKFFETNNFLESGQQFNQIIYHNNELLFANPNSCQAT